MTNKNNMQSVRPTRWIVLLVTAIVLLAGVYIAAVLTSWGQLLENTALRGADQVNRQDLLEASDSLYSITIWSLAISILLVGLVGFLRKKFLLAFLAMGVIVGGQVITQSLKRFILPRPELVPVVGDFTNNSFPSGHTTIAMTVLVATFLVVPYRIRGLTMLFVLLWSSAIGSYTLTAKWHRLSDTIGADLVALIVGSIAAIVLVRSGRVSRVLDPAKKLRTVMVSIAVFGAVLLFAIGVFLVMFSPFDSLRDPVIEWNIYLAATSFSTSISIFTALIFWGTWRRLEVTN